MFSPPVIENPKPAVDTGSLSRASFVGIILLALSLGMAAMAPLDGAVIVQGRILVEGKPQPVQSLNPGIVTHVAVKSGDRVEAGDTILTLDPALPQARLNIAMEQLAQALAEEARLNAEAQGQITPDFTTSPLPFPTPDMAVATSRQKALFETRLAQLDHLRQQTRETDSQILAQISGLAAQIAAATEEADILTDDLERMADLTARNLARQSALTEIRRQNATLEGNLARLRAEKARLEGSRRAAALSLIQEENLRQEDIASGLRDVSGRIQELKTEVISLRETLARSTLHAPISGIIHELTVPAPGAVIAAGATLAEIVPTDRAMEIEISVDPRNIENIFEGQPAEVQISGLDPRNMPRLPAIVTRIPPGVANDPQSGRSFYRVSLRLEQDKLPRGHELRPGMPVQAFLSTGERTLAAWLLAPLLRPMTHALRES
ncbi:MAG: HlyD family type I secretion periplasmic adaptor subunit [Pseudorhodobacter sp.]